jgi:glycosyltransferase involved in cell wall biosynthesis
MISYVVNAFGKRAHLPAVLAAIRCQRGLETYEIIIVDPGSTDGVGAYAEAEAANDPHLRVLHVEDKGPGQAINAGLAVAHFPLCHLLDGDDLLAPTATATLLSDVNTHSADAVIAQGGFYTGAAPVFPADIPAPTWVVPPEDALRAMIRYAPSNMSGTLIRTDFARAFGGCDARVWVHDYSLSLRACRAGRVVLTDRPVWQGPATDESRIMLSQKRQMFHDFNAALAYLVEDHPELPGAVQRLALNRATGRAVKWLRREARQSAPVAAFWRYGLSYLPPQVPLSVAPMLRATLPAFEATGKVRRP